MYNAIVLRDLVFVLMGNIKRFFPPNSIAKKSFLEALAILLKMPDEVVRSWQSWGSMPDESAVEKMIRLEQVLRGMGEMIKAEDRFRFLCNVNSGLQNLRPIDCLDTETDMRAVMRLFKEAETGSFS